MKYKVGIDVGGTNTDVVVVDANKKIVACLKETTTFPQDRGVIAALSKLIERGLSPNEIMQVCVGTTHATNALLEAKNLLSVGVIRIAGHKPKLSCGLAWPSELQKVIRGVETINGGYECHGGEITPFQRAEAKEAIRRLLEQGVEALAIVGVFSPMKRDQEDVVYELIQELAPKMPVTRSCDLGGIGFLERENAAILNSSLKKVIGDGFKKLESGLKEIGITAPLKMIHNDGSMMSFAKALEFPLFTISAGQTNSFRGGAVLAGAKRALVVDVGGTSSDIGIVEDGYPKRSTHIATIGGVKMQFSLPDVCSLALGGGSIITREPDVKIGPKSVSRELFSRAMCFGGDVLTLTDVGIATGCLQIDQAQRQKVPLRNEEALALLKKVHEEITASALIMRGKNGEYPLIAVGGGAPLLQEAGFSIPEYAPYANAYGAALAEVSATLDLVVALDERVKVLEELKAEAVKQALERGAGKDSVRVIGVDVTPYAYSANGLSRVVVTAVG